MRLIEIENYKSDLPGALKQASVDVPILEQAFKDAETALAKAETERQRWLRNYGQVSSEISVLAQKYRDAKRRVMMLEAETGGLGDTGSGWQAYRRLKNDYDGKVATFAFLSVHPQPEADLAHAEAAINERVAYAALLEGRAARARCGVLVATMTAQQYDPGIQLDVSASWSNAESQKAHEIMSREVPGLREQLASKRAQVERNRQDMDAGIWN